MTGQFYAVDNLLTGEENDGSIAVDGLTVQTPDDTYAHVLPSADEQTAHALARHILEGTAS